MRDTTAPARTRQHSRGRRAATPRTLRRRLQRISVLPGLVTVPMLLIAIYLTRDPAHQLSHGWLIWSVVTSACAFASAVAWSMSMSVADMLPDLEERDSARRERDSAYAALSLVVNILDDGRHSLRSAAEQANRGEVRTDFPLPVVATPTGDVCRDAVALAQQCADEPWKTVMLVAAGQHRKVNPQDELAEIFKAISPRLQSLVNQTIKAVSEVEFSIEDPEELAGLYRVDHLVTQILRLAESLAILAGRTPPRDSDPVPLATAIRRAVQEIPKYERVRVARSALAAATLPGYVSPSVVHVLAALMENATHYSDQRVEVYLHEAPGGIAVEVVDRGLGMSQAKRDELNRMLEAPTADDLRVRLREGQLGLLVAALHAEHHKITIQLEPTVVGGTRALILLPPGLLVSAQAPPPRQGADPRVAAPTGPVRRQQPLPGPEVTTEVPRRAPVVPPDQAAPVNSAASDGPRPALPRRTRAEAPPTAPASNAAPDTPSTSTSSGHAPDSTAALGHAPGGLMASFLPYEPRPDTASSDFLPPAG